MLFISEVLPNPVGNDKGMEWVELANNSETSINLSGFALQDASGKLQKLQGEIAPHGFFVVGLKGKGNLDLNLSLNNSEEALVLLSPSQMVLDSVKWSAAPEGESFARNGSTFLWTKVLTPGAPNSIQSALFENRLLSQNTAVVSGTLSIETALFLAVFFGIGAVVLGRFLSLFHGEIES
jgi:hypothetical protein